MIKRTLVLMTLAAVGALIAIAAAPAQSRVVTLRGAVTADAKITLTQNGKKVTRLKAGTYRIVVRDASGDHNFALRKAGGATKQLTTVPFTGTRTATVTLTNGRWEFFCVPHESFMRGSVSVGSAAALQSAPTATTTTTDDEPGDDRGRRHGGHGADD